MSRWWLLLLVLSLGLNTGLLWRVLERRPEPLPPPEQAARGRAEGGVEWEKRAEARHRRLADRIGLDPLRRARFLDIRREAVPTLLSLRQDVREARHELHGVLREAPSDTQRLHSCLARLAAAQGRVDSLVVSNMRRELGLLEPREREIYLSAMPWEGDHGPPARGLGPRRTPPGRDP